MNSWFYFDDCLAPGDQKSRAFDAGGIEVISIESVDHPLFEKAFLALWSEFGEKAEIEQRSVIQSRLEWQGRKFDSNERYFYQLLWIEKGGIPFGVRDHTVIYRPEQNRIVVHLSHNFLFPIARRTGLAGWMRGWPLLLARQCQKEWGIDLPISLVAEMEPVHPDYPERLPRLISVEKAGFLKVKDFDYLQPDFRAPEAIDLTGDSAPLEMSLIVRRVEEEGSGAISGKELHDMVTSLYRMYGRGLRASEMKSPWTKVAQIDLKSNYLLVKPTLFDDKVN